MKQKETTKLLVGFVTTALLASGLSACDGNNAMTNDGKPIVKVLVVKNTNQIKMADMTWAKELEEDCDCSIEWQEVSDEQWSQQKSASLAAGEISDLNIRAFNPDDAARNLSAFEPLGDHLDEMPNVKSFFEAQPIAQKFVSVDGQVTVLPSSRTKGYLTSGQHFLINRAWLNKLNLSVPTTWDELRNVLTIFKTQDPNGNGIADEIPMNLNAITTWAMGGWWSPFLMLNATGIVTHFNSGPSQTGIYVKNGKVGNWMQTDEFRKVIEFYYELKEKGLVPDDWMAATADTYNTRNLSDGETPIVGVVFGWDQSAFGNYGTSIAEQYETIPIPAADGMDQDDVVWDGSLEANRFEDYHMSMSANANNKETCYKLIDLLYSEKYSLQQMYGSLTDGYLEQTGQHSYRVTQKMREAQIAQQVPALEDRLAGWISDDIEIEGDLNMNNVAAADVVYMDQYDNYDHEKDMMPIYVRVPLDQRNTLSNNDTELFNYALPIVSNWLLNGGAEDDTQWNEFQQNLKSYKIEESINIWQDAYDSYVK